MLISQNKFSLLYALLPLSDLYDDRSGQTKNFLANPPLEIEIKKKDMNDIMTFDIVGHSVSVMDYTSDNVNATANITRFMNEQFGGTWLAVVEKDYVPIESIPHVKETYIAFSYKQNRYVVALQMNKVSK